MKKLPRACIINPYCNGLDEEVQNDKPLKLNETNSVIQAFMHSYIDKIPGVELGALRYIFVEPIT